MSDTLTVKLAGQSLARGFEDTGPLVGKSGQGKQAGNLAGVHKWLGVPFGQPKRWDIIRSTPEWEGFKECNEFSSRPVAGVEPLETLWEDMDGVDDRSFIMTDEGTSLTLNVFKPASASFEGKLPVLVFHHGGGLNVGHAGVFVHDPTELIRYSESLSKPMIVVTFNYRLNIFGFLDHPDLAAETGVAGNYGFHDQIAALEWIQRYISEFGGDPDNVTCMGNSAGGFALSLILGRNRVNSTFKLFKRIILQSGTIGTAPFRPPAYSYPFYDDLLRHFNIEATTPSERVQALRAVPADALFAFANEHRPPGGWGAYEETGPNAVFDQSPLEVLKRGLWDPEVEAVLLGNVEDEGTMFGPVFNIDKPEVFQAMLGRFSPEQQGQIQDLYPDRSGDEYDAKTSAFCQFMGDQLFKGPITLVSNMLSTTLCEASGKKLPVYKYLFKGKMANDSANTLGSLHTVELPFIFQTLTLWKTGSEQEKTAKVIGRHWIDFVHGERKGWPTVQDEKQLVFRESGGVTQESIVGDGDAVSRIKFWTKALDI
ncbi:hypothetical protein IAR55_006001 [Kwoniella newhampshirensis]|uniref:Carboxylesterase type B domain-containing protein n=1 Tax=Kwoniella newhampshirensis TaxID=1651941 RepID=A0AAW0YTP7_9TREE